MEFDTLPDGFILDTPASPGATQGQTKQTFDSLPPGFVLDTPPSPTTDSTFLHTVGQYTKGGLGAASAVENTMMSARPQAPVEVEHSEAETPPSYMLMPSGKPIPTLGPFIQNPAVKELLPTPAADVAQKIPEKPGLENSWTYTRIPKALGALSTLLAITAAGRATPLISSKLPGLILGGLFGVDYIDKDLKSKGLVPADRPAATAASAAVGGALMEAPVTVALRPLVGSGQVGTLLKTLDDMSGGMLRKAASRGATALTMSVINMLQTTSGNAIARQWYDENRPLLEGVSDAGLEGLITGGTIDVGRAGLRRYIHGPSTGTIPTAEELGITREDYVNRTSQNPSEVPINDVGYQRIQDQMSTGADSLSARNQAIIDKTFAPASPEIPIERDMRGSYTPTEPSAVGYKPEGFESKGIEEPPIPKGPETRELPYSPVQEALQMRFMDRTIAEHTAAALSNVLGRRFYVWVVPGEGLRLRMGPQPDMTPQVSNEPTQPELPKGKRLGMSPEELRASEEMSSAEYIVDEQKHVSDIRETVDKEIAQQDAAITEGVPEYVRAPSLTLPVPPTKHTTPEEYQHYLKTSVELLYTDNWKAALNQLLLGHEVYASDALSHRYGELYGAGYTTEKNIKEALRTIRKMALHEGKTAGQVLDTLEAYIFHDQVQADELNDFRKGILDAKEVPPTAKADTFLERATSSTFKSEGAAKINHIREVESLQNIIRGLHNGDPLRSLTFSFGPKRASVLYDVLSKEMSTRSDWYNISAEDVLNQAEPEIMNEQKHLSEIRNKLDESIAKQEVADQDAETGTSPTSPSVASETSKTNPLKDALSATFRSLSAAKIMVSRLRRQGVDVPLEVLDEDGVYSIRKKEDQKRIGRSAKERAERDLVDYMEESERSFEGGHEGDESLPERTDSTFKLYSFGPDTFKDFFKDLGETKKLIGGNVFEKLTRQYWGRLGTPQWAAERYPVLKKGMKIAGDAHEYSAPRIKERLDEVKQWTKMSNQGKAQVRGMIKALDENATLDLAAVKSKSITVDRSGTLPVIAPNATYFKELGAWLSTKNLLPEAQSMVIAYRRGLTQAFVDKINMSAKEPGFDRNTLENLISHIGYVQNYFPHMWYGKHYIEGRDASGKTVARLPFDEGMLGEGIGRMLKGRAIVAALKNDPLLQKAGVVDWDAAPKRADALERYWLNSPVPLDTMMSLIDQSVARIEEKARTTGDTGLLDFAKAMRRTIPEETAQILKTKGFGNFAKREGMLGYEREDIMKVYFDYVSGVYNSLAKMQKARAYTKLAYETTEKRSPFEYKLMSDFIKDDMGAPSVYDKAVDNARMLLFARHLGGRVKPAIVNMTNLLTTSVPMLHTHATGAGFLHTQAAADVMRQWMKEYPEHRKIVGIQGSAKGNVLSAVEVRALRDLFATGHIQSQLYNEYKGALRDEYSWNWRTLNILGKPMEMTEGYIRATTALAALRAFAEGKIMRAQTLEKYGLTKGVPVDISNEASYLKAVDFAADVIEKAHRTYAKYNNPPVVRQSGALKSMYTFRSFSQHLMEMWTWMAQQDGSRGKRAVIGSILGQAALGGIAGVPLASLFMRMYRSVTGDDPEQKLREALPDNDLLRDVVTMGGPAAGGIYLGGSMEVDVPSSVTEILGVPAAAATDIYDAWNAYASGNPKRAIEYMAPLIVVRDLLSAVRGYTEGTRTVGGRPISPPGTLEPTHLTPLEAGAKALGFRPASTERMFRVQEAGRVLSDRRRDAQKMFADRYVNAANEEDYEKATRVLDEVIAWNLKAVSSGQVDQMISKEMLTASLRDRLGLRMKRKGERIMESIRAQAYGLR